MLTGADQEGRQPRASGQVVQGRPQDHRVSDSHRRHAGVPRRALHAAVCRIDVPGHGPRPSTGAIRDPTQVSTFIFFLGERVFMYALGGTL